MFFKSKDFSIWIPSILALFAKENFELVKTKNNKNLKVKSSSKQYVKSMNQKKVVNKKTYYNKKK